MTLGEFRRKTAHYSDSVLIVVEQTVNAETGDLGVFLDEDELSEATYDVNDQLASVASEPEDILWKTVPYMDKNGDVRDKKQCVVIVLD